MLQRLPLRRALALTAGLALLAPASAALAGEGGGWRDGSWHPEAEQAAPPVRDPRETYRGDGYEPGDRSRRERHDDAGWRRDPRPQYDVPGRDAWLADCRQRVSSRDRGVGGAVIGGVAGGVLGNRIAGRGNRTVGTVAGAAVGAAAGVAIDRAEDRGRRADECEAYLDDYYARYYAGGQGAPLAYAQSGYVQPGYAPYAAGYAGCCGTPMMMVPVRSEPECTETVEYVYEDVPVRTTYRPAPVKRTRIAPDKRVKVVADKRIRTK